MNVQSPRRQRGFTLIELMVALLLGLLVVAAAGSIFLSNRRVYGSTEAVGRIQENQRAAFEMMARDIREAGVNPCSRFTAANPITVQMTGADAQFWGRFANGMFGDTSDGNDAVSLYLANGREYRVQAHARPGDAVTLNTAAGLVSGQALMVCNSDQAIVFSVTGISGAAVQHAAGNNCGAGLTPTPDLGQCSAAVSGPGYCFRVAGTPTAADVTACPRGIGRSPAFVVVPYEARWTVGSNTRGGSSLYRTVQGARSEIAEGVSAMALRYKIGSASGYVTAADVEAAAAWGRVTAIHLALTLQAERGSMTDSDRRGVDGAVLSRTMEDYIVLRNHQDDIQ
ncbi:prepilin-type N-terminal cleavage/methylation domain-containing protein [uncultured Stenotrophomonas sp.]|uniref:PilW family protein n=1 Tax=uncultured Stenotrophomonas sp. TaxID=165438 RepID=UPI0025D15395|nr:prepilin-type N-terminal cleavage/methylation domain-containing protein [uncultured Stenotrophomonas sp.]